MDDRLMTPDGRVRTELQLTTAEILYYLPDHPMILQSFVWQHYDTAPRFPRLLRFLDFWRSSIEATLADVLVAHQEFDGLRSRRLRLVGHEWQMN